VKSITGGEGAKEKGKRKERNVCGKNARKSGGAVIEGNYLTGGCPGWERWQENTKNPWKGELKTETQKS